MSAGLPVRVAVDGVSLDFSNLPVAKLAPGTDKQSLFVTAGAPTWQSNGWTWSALTYGLNSGNLNTGGTTSIVCSFPDLNQSGFGTIGTGLTGSPLTGTNNSANFVCNKNCTVELVLTGNITPDANSGQTTQPVVSVNGVTYAFFPKTFPAVANSTFGYQGSAIVKLNSGDVVQIRATGTGVGNLVLNNGYLSIKLVSFNS